MILEFQSSATIKIPLKRVNKPEDESHKYYQKIFGHQKHLFFFFLKKKLHKEFETCLRPLHFPLLWYYLYSLKYKKTNIYIDTRLF